MGKAISEEEKHKAVAQWKLQLNGALDVFDMYGLGHDIPRVKEIITELALQLHKRLNGIDHPITLNHAEQRYSRRRGKLSG